jgi:hypothetical protein
MEPVRLRATEFAAEWLRRNMAVQHLLNRGLGAFMPMTPTFRNVRSKLSRALQFILPQSSSLDAIFNSYDDYREMRRKSLEKRAAKREAERSARTDRSDRSTSESAEDDESRLKSR